MKKRLILTLLFVMICVALLTTACGTGGWRDGSAGTDQQIQTLQPDPTAVYGANEFHAQLTAIARQSSP
jgi:hypothetical protein